MYSPLLGTTYLISIGVLIFRGYCGCPLEIQLLYTFCCRNRLHFRRNRTREAGRTNLLADMFISMLALLRGIFLILLRKDLSAQKALVIPFHTWQLPCMRILSRNVPLSSSYPFHGLSWTNSTEPKSPSSPSLSTGMLTQQISRRLLPLK